MILQNQLSLTKGHADLALACTEINEVYKHGNHITQMLSRSDLLQLAGYAAVEYCGGPSMIFRMGREDMVNEGDSHASTEETSIVAVDTHRNSLIVSRLQSEQANLSPEEFVALMGIHTLGFEGENKKGPMTRWTQNPYVFDNTYYKELLAGQNSRYFSSETDHRLVAQPELRHWVEAYAQDQDLFFVNYAKAHVKASEFGADNLMSEF